MKLAKEKKSFTTEKKETSTELEENVIKEKKQNIMALK
jgi:hypothetical protein